MSNKIGLTGFGGSGLIRSGACFVIAMKYVNEDSAVRFLQIFDAAAIADVTFGTTTPAWVLTAGANGGDDDFIGGGLKFDRGIVAGGTTTATGNVAAANGTQHFFGAIE